MSETSNILTLHSGASPTTLFRSAIEHLLKCRTRTPQDQILSYCEKISTEQLENLISLQELAHQALRNQAWLQKKESALRAFQEGLLQPLLELERSDSQLKAPDHDVFYELCLDALVFVEWVNDTNFLQQNRRSREFLLPESPLCAPSIQATES